MKKQLIPQVILTLLLTFFFSSLTLAQSWDFEDGSAGNWAVNTGTLEASTDVAFTGNQSLKITSTDASNQVEFENQSFKDAQPTDTLKFMVWVDEANKANISGFQLFYKSGADWTWNAEWNNGSDLTAGGWTKLFVVIPEDFDETIQSFGLQLNEAEAANVTTFYVDAIEVAPKVDAPAPDYTPTVFNFEDGLNNFSITNNATAETSFDYSLGEGFQSVKIAGVAGETTTAFANSTFTEISGKDTVDFNVFITDNSELSTFKVFVKDGPDFTFHDQSYDAANLSLNQWNKLTLIVPDAVSDVREFGLQIDYTSDGTPVVYVDNARVAPFNPASVEPIEPVFETWDFEEGAGNWGIANSTGTLEIADDASYSGFQSLKVTANPDTHLVEIANDAPSNYAPEQTLSFHIWVPADVSKINGISPFIQTDNYSSYTSNFYAVGDLEAEAWNQVLVTVPEYNQIDGIGLQILGNDGATDLPPFYVDMASTDPEYAGTPTLTAPTNATQDSLGKTFTAFSWEASTGTGSPQYLIYRNSEVVDTTANTFYVDTNVLSDTEYSYQIATLDPFGRETEPTSTLTITTEAFETHTTWDFETDLENWSGNAASTILVDFSAYSGQQSVLVTGDGSASENYFQTDSGVSDLIPGQTLTYQVWISEGAAGQLNGINAFIKHGADFTWVASWHDDFEVGAWNALSIQIPDTIEANSVVEAGIQLSKNDASATPSVFVDFINTDPTNKGIPTISAPTNLEAGTPTKSGVTLSWEASTGIGSDITYNVYSSYIATGGGLPAIYETFEGSTSDTSYQVTGLASGEEYSFEVTAIDYTGKETDRSNKVTITTDDFSTHATFDFERGMQGWTTAGGSAERTTERAFSGVNSVKFTNSATEGFFELIDSDTEAPGTPTIGDIQLGHTLTYRLWIPADQMDKIDFFQVWFKDGTWTWGGESGENVTGISPDDIEADTWNEVSVTIPSTTANLNSVGLQVIAAEGETPTVYIDLISTQQNPEVRPHISIPGNFTAAEITSSFVDLTWEKPTGDNNNYLFELYRGDADAENWSDFTLLQSINKSITSYTDDNLSATSTYRYRLVAVTEFDGQTEPATLEVTTLENVSTEDENMIPDKFDLAHNYPNPFNPTTQIRYDVPQTSSVTLSVYSLTGQLVGTLVNETKNAGRHTVTFRADDLASGIYFYQIEAGSFTKVRRMMLIK